MKTQIDNGITAFHQLLGSDAETIEALIIQYGHPSYIDLITEATNNVVSLEKSLPENWEDADPDTYEICLAIESEWNRLCGLYFDTGLRGLSLLEAFLKRSL